jgi:hypothetical protein
MTEAVELAKLWGADAVDEALGLAAFAGRFRPEDLVSILTSRRFATARQRRPLAAARHGRLGRFRGGHRPALGCRPGCGSRL